MWVDCDFTIVQAFRDACRLVIAGTIEESEYPLIWNCHFISDTNYQELCEDHRYKAAARQKAFVTKHFTFPVGGINEAVDPFMDSPTINYGTEFKPILKSNKCRARLILKAAVITQPNKTRISLIDKIQNPHHRLGQWHFQGKRRTAALTSEFIDRTLPRLLARWYSHPDNNKEGNLSFNNLGTFTRQYKEVKDNGRTVAASGVGLS